MLSDTNLMAMYDVEMPGMMPPMTSGSAMTNGTGSCGTPLPISKGNISARRIESEEEHSVEKFRPVLCSLPYLKVPDRAVGAQLIPGHNKVARWELM